MDRFVRACGFAMLYTFMLAGEASAQDMRWTSEPRFYLAGMQYYFATDDAWSSFDTLAATAELRIKPCKRSWYAGLFSEYRFSTDRLQRDKLNIGGLINFGRFRWDARVYAFVNTSPQTKNTWVYAGRLRYRLAGHHKIGLEAIGKLRHAKAPQLLLAYYGTLTDSLSLTLAGGRGTDDGPDLSARVELVWQVF